MKRKPTLQLVRMMPPKTPQPLDKYLKVKKLTVVIVSYNVKYYLEQCLNSLNRALQGIDSEVYVIDNHSRDGSVAYLERRFSQVNFVSSNHNLGFARANNIGIRDSESDYVLLLNPDTFVAESTIRKCIDFMDEHPNAGACGVKMLQVDGEKAMESRRGVPDPLTSFYKMTGLCSRFPTHRRLGHYYMGGLPWDKPAEIEIVSGAFCMLRRSALDKVGLLDEDFFMYGEDIDLSFRILKGGFTNWYIPCSILHYKGESTQKSSFRYVHVFYDAMLIFLRKHYGHLSLFLSLPIKIAIYGKAFFALTGMLNHGLRKAFGLFHSASKMFPEFLFLGDRTAVDQCRRIARQKGLVGRYIVCNYESNPDGHLSELESFDPQKKYQIVYDTDSYSYEQILHIFESHPLPNLFIGTYNRKSRTIITTDEIYRHV